MCGRLIVVAMAALLAPAQEPGRIAGRVVDRKSAEPVVRAQVNLAGAGGERAAVLTDGSGVFEFDKLPVGRYRISAERAGYSPLDENGRVVAVESGAVTGGVELVLRRLGSISGRVTDEYGDPVVRANVAVMTGGSGVHTATTNDRGEYRAFDIPRGDHQVVVTSATRRTLSAILAKPSKDTEEYAPVFYPGVTDPGQALAVALDDASDLQGIDIRLVRARRVTVQGRLRFSGAGADASPEVRVRMMMIRPMPMHVERDAGVRDQPFVFSGLFPGTYLISATANTSDGRPALAGHRVVRVGNTDTDIGDLVLAPLANLTVRVAFPEGRKMPRNSKFRVLPAELDSFLGTHEVQPTGDGTTFRAARLEAGEYEIRLDTEGELADCYVSETTAGKGPLISVSGGAQELAVKLKAGAASALIDVAEPATGPALNVVVKLLAEGSSRPREFSCFESCRLTAIAPGEYRVFAALMGRPTDDPEFLTRNERYVKKVRLAEGEQQKLRLEVVPDLAN